MSAGVMPRLIHFGLDRSPAPISFPNKKVAAMIIGSRDLIVVEINKEQQKLRASSIEPDRASPLEASLAV